MPAPCRLSENQPSDVTPDPPPGRRIPVRKTEGGGPGAAALWLSPAAHAAAAKAERRIGSGSSGSTARNGRRCAVGRSQARHRYAPADRDAAGGQSAPERDFVADQPDRCDALARPDRDRQVRARMLGMPTPRRPSRSRTATTRAPMAGFPRPACARGLAAGLQ
jgi:hypothetical protein